VRASQAKRGRKNIAHAEHNTCNTQHACARAPSLPATPARPFHKLTTARRSEQGGEQQPGALSPRCAAACRVPCLRAQHHRCDCDQLCVLHASRVAQRRAAWRVECVRRAPLIDLRARSCLVVGMSRVPIPTHLLDKAHTPSLYKVAASVHISLGTAVEPQVAASADARSLVGGGRGPAGMLRGLMAVRDKDRASLGAFRFFGNTVSSARVDLRRAKGEEAGCSRSGGDGAGAGDTGCGGTIGGVARVRNVGRGRETTLCRVDFENACELCLHSRQPLKNLNIVAELVVTVTNAQNDVDSSHESICWTIVPLTYACCV
jgi:hypothetical protein